MATEYWELTMLEAFRMLRKDGKLCDMTLISGDTTQFAVHSLVVTVASPVIMELVLQGNTTLSFPDIQSDVLGVILDLIYSGTMHILKSPMEPLSPLAYTKSAELLQLHPILKQELGKWLCSVDGDIKMEEVQKVEDDVTSIKWVVLDSQQKDNTLTTYEPAEVMSPGKIKMEENSDVASTTETEDNPECAAIGTAQKTGETSPTESQKLIYIRPKRKRTMPKELSHFLIDNRSIRKKTRVGRKQLVKDDYACQSVVEVNLDETDVDKSMCVDEELSKTKDNILEHVPTVSYEGDVAEDPEDVNDLKSVDKMWCNATQVCREINIDIKTEYAGIEETDETQTVTKELLSEDNTTAGTEEPTEIGGGIPSPRKIHKISRAVLQKLKMLEKKSKESKKITVGRKDMESKDPEQTVVPVMNEDLVIKCISCGLQCSAAFVKCLLCLERLPRDNMRDHMALEHPFYGHVNCWMSCGYRHNSAVLGELRDRVVAKKIYAKTGDSVDRSTTFQCSICRCRENAAEAMREHLANDHEIPKCYMCETCGDVFKNPGTKREHKHFCTGGEPMKCDQCFKVLDGLKSLWMHVRTEHEDIRKTGDITSKTPVEIQGNPRFKIAECMKCGPGCSGEHVECMLCLLVMSKDDLLSHIQSCHKYSPTYHFMFRCKDVSAKEGANKKSQVELVLGKHVSDMASAVDEASESLTSSKCRLECSLCSEQCTGITTFGKHCRYEHNVKIVFSCKACKDVFKTVAMRDKHYKYCVYGQGSAVVKEGGSVEASTDSSFLTVALHQYSSLAPPHVLEDIPEIEHGVINKNAQQKSRCLMCAKNLHNCMSKVLRCFLCHQYISAECLDEHMSQQHAHLQGSQCFTCGRKAKTSQKPDQFVIGFNMIFNDSAKAGGTEANDVDPITGSTETIGVTCLYCGSQFVEFKDFVEHFSDQHQITEMHHCSKCPLIFCTKFSQTDHEFFCDHGGAPYCQTCNLLFASPQMWRKHNREQHSLKVDESLVTVKCPYCESYEKKGITRYRVHLRTVHQLDKIFVCKICFEAFDQAYKKDLHEHEAHSNKETFCSECEKNFSTPIKLQRHINYWHKGGKHKEMARRRQVTEKLCQYCGKGFKVLANLTDHVNRYHLQHKPYQCAYCDKSFYHTFAKQKHEFKDHAAGYYQCSFCTHKAYSNWDLKKHVERVHGTSYMEKNNCSKIELKQETITSGHTEVERPEKAVQKPMYIHEGDFVEAVTNPTSSTDVQAAETESRHELEYGAEVVEASSLQNVVYQIQDEQGQVYEVKGIEDGGGQGLNVMTVAQNYPQTAQYDQGQDIANEEMVILLSNTTT